MTNAPCLSLGSIAVEPDFGVDDDGPFFAWLPPEDRLWRHPSEVPAGSSASRPGRSSRPNVRTNVRSSGRSWVRGGRIWTVAVLAGTVGAMTASGLGMVTGIFASQTTVIRPVIPSDSPSVSLAAESGSDVNLGSDINWTAVDDAVAPSVVAVGVSGPGGPSIGSGLLMIDGERDAYVVTDRSLLDGDGSPGSIEVTFLSGEQAPARLVGQDAPSGLAVLSVPNLQRTFPAVGSVADLQVASPVLALGARTVPGGSVFPGSVSAEDRDVDVDGGSDMQNLIAISTPEIPSSVAGGPLVDQYGRVVGITVNVDPTDPMYQNLTFAVPVDEAEHVAQQILSGVPVTHPWLGLTDSVDLTSAVSRLMGLAGGAQAGVVAPKSPAAELGIQPSDVITSFDGQPVTSAGDLMALLDECPPGRMTSISYIQQGRTTETTVMVSNQPADS